MGERRKRRGRDPQGAAWTGNNCLEAQVLRVLIKDPFPRGGDEACHFDVAPGMRAKGPAEDPFASRFHIHA